MAFFNKKDEAPDVSAQILQQLQALTERVAAIEKSTQAQSPAPSTNADEAKQPEPNAAQTPVPDNKAAETPAPATEEKKADDDDMNVAPNPFAGIDPAVFGAVILQALTDAKADKKADEKADECKKEEAKKDAKPETKLDAAMIRDAADIAQILQQLQALTERVAAIEKSTQAQSPAPSTNADEAKQPETNEAQTQTPAPDNKAVESPAPATEEKKADDDDMNVAPNPLAGIDPAVFGAAILQALTDAKADKKADEKADKCKKEEAKKDAKPEIKLDAAMIRDAADIAPSLAPTTPNLPYAAILEFAKSQQGKSFVDSFGDLSKCDHAMVLRACANFKRSMTQATLATVKHDEAPKKAKSFVEQSAELWNKAK